jgi:hypothetical protein
MQIVCSVPQWVRKSERYGQTTNGISRITRLSQRARAGPKRNVRGWSYACCGLSGANEDGGRADDSIAHVHGSGVRRCQALHRAQYWDHAPGTHGRRGSRTRNKGLESLRQDLVCQTLGGSTAAEVRVVDCRIRVVGVALIVSDGCCRCRVLLLCTV